jgi:PhzF family phenazine biosynthesis protein
MKIPLYQIDAFASKVFSGNPAGVCPLEDWLSDDQMQSIAMENNLAETAFFVKQHDHYQLRWFTPKVEVDLCGHATLASGFVIFNYLDPSAHSVLFQTKSGALVVRRDGDVLAMDFPARKAVPHSTDPAIIARALGAIPREILFSRDYLVVFESEQAIRTLKPDMNLLMKLDGLGVIVTAPGEKSDFVSRFFAPKVGIPEDPVTGSAHCTLIPYWSERLGKKKLHAFQVSPRGGELFCEDQGDRVQIAGSAVRYSEGFLYL